jgi:membrane protease YdiL (CAAX protease family)
MPNPTPRWHRVAVFFLLACAWSWPLFWLRDMHPDTWAALPLPHPLKNTVLMWGPGLAALACMALFRRHHTPTITVWGGQRLRSLAFYAVPLLALAAVGVPGQGGERMHAFVALLGVIGFINVLGEELGWRGYLQDVLRPVPRVWRYLTVGLLWITWHFTNVFAHREGAELLGYLAWYAPVTIALSAVLGECTERSRALAVAVTLHAWMNISMEFGDVRVWSVLAASVVFWGWMLWRWPREGVAGR